MDGISAELREWVVALRRRFHRCPEPSGAEHETQRIVREVLDGLGIEHRAAAGTGVVGSIRGAGPGPTLALRADMDALHILEAETPRNAEYRSTRDGWMHACGHDGHLAMLLGAARRLQETRDRWRGEVRLVVQPAEETPPGGAGAMIADGALDGVEGILGIHLFGDVDAGEVRFRAGPFMADARGYRLTVTGRGGHHLNPDQCIDPIPIAAEFAASVQEALRAALDPAARWVFGFGQFQAGTQFNQTPDEASVGGTFRVFEDDVGAAIERVLRGRLDELMVRHARPGIPGLPRYRLEVAAGYPPLCNDERFVRRAAAVLAPGFPRVVADAPASFGAEDFARYLERVPGLFLFLGVRNPARGIDAVNHSARFDLDEAVLGEGVRLFLTLARDFLADPRPWLGG